MPTKSASTNCRSSNRVAAKRAMQNQPNADLYLEQDNDSPIKPTKLRPSTAFPVRLILAVYQFFKVMRQNAELAKLAHRKAYREVFGEGLRGVELSAHVARSAQACGPKTLPYVRRPSRPSCY
jgi:hypothetical protein